MLQLTINDLEELDSEILEYTNGGKADKLGWIQLLLSEMDDMIKGWNAARAERQKLFLK